MRAAIDGEVFGMQEVRCRAILFDLEQEAALLEKGEV
jgi:hypothetical protein